MASSPILLLGLLSVFAVLAVVSGIPVQNDYPSGVVAGNLEGNANHDLKEPVVVFAPVEVPKPIGVSQVVSPVNAVVVPAYYPYLDSRQAQISNGVNTIVGGARTGNVEQILRGAFSIPSSYHVRGTANGILDTIFGRRYYDYY
ncbi:unnamed protein product [Allacma fusca]|uniref:Uncharacterized protein n=1 Tax=Allacma fusca TaxID=39272 RepID=A0A8J2KYL2_9HEXA|nr:unnamed protein product [Allacma fusca]